MVSQFADMMAREGLNIERLDTRVKADDIGQPIFYIRGHASVVSPLGFDMSSLRSEALRLQGDLGMAILLEEHTA